MKKHIALAFVLVALIALLLVPMQDATAQAAFYPCNPMFIPTGIVDPGAWTYPGGNIHVRGMVSRYQQTASDPRCTGLNTSVTNANWDAAGVGPMWGTFNMVLEEDGLNGWEGTWTGMSYADGSRSLHVEGRGYGELEGWRVLVDIEFSGPYLPGIGTGYILDPHGE
jgi:hypothetical protein